MYLHKCVYNPCRSRGSWRVRNTTFNQLTRGDDAGVTAALQYWLLHYLLKLVDHCQLRSVEE